MSIRLDGLPVTWSPNSRVAGWVWPIFGLLSCGLLWAIQAPIWAQVLGFGMWMPAWVLSRVLVGGVKVAVEQASQPDAGASLAHHSQAPASAPGSLLGTLAPAAPAASDNPDRTADGGQALAQLQHELLQQRIDEQEALRYALSHDLRAPLRVIDGFTRIVKEDYGRHLDRLGQDHLDRVLAAGARMNDMIDAILSQAQLSAGDVKREEIDLSSLAQDVIAELQPAATQGAAPCASWQIERGLRARGDALLVRRVLENLLGNALKYSGKVQQAHIEFGRMPATNPPVFFVRDNGAGFDMLHADKLFGLFQRLHSAREFPGTGVGLAGVRSIVQRHGGRVWAEGRQGEGACFYFTLMDSAQAQRTEACQ